MIKILFKILLIFHVTLFFSCQSEVENVVEISRQPTLFPDYTGILIPPNIAPLNFKISEPGVAYKVSISVDGEDPIIIRSKNPDIQIGINSWKKLLGKGIGKEIYFDVFVKTSEEKWQHFQRVTNSISTEKIDNHLAYRLINTGYVLWTNLGIYQRNLETFEEKPILENKSIEYGCLNCHSFANNNPDKMLLHIRDNNGGTIVSKNGELIKVNTKTSYTLSAGAYPNWNPDGKHIALSVNNIGQFFCSGETRIEVADMLSDLVVYNVENNTISTSPKVSTASRENLPIWSPDGKYIYFISAAPGIEINDRIQGKYDLLRIGYDIQTDTWGNIDTVLTGKAIGKSISFPKISPNGKYLMFCTSDNGYFTIHHPQTDLNLIDLNTGKFWEMDINSAETESYHSFSSTGHWFVFSSKRMDGLFTRPFFSYLDDNGKATKPFVMPQKDPEFYNSFIKNYNIPELIKGEVPYTPMELRDAVLKPAIPAKIDPGVDTVYMKRHLLMKE